MPVTSNEARYAERLNRYVAAMRNQKPDRVPIRPFVAEFAAKYAGYNCQQVTHDYELAFLAARKCAADFDWDAVVGNMVYVWTALTQALDLKYYAIPGLHIPPETGFQYMEPSEANSYMEEDEYDELIEDPVAFLYNKWLPRVSGNVAAPGSPNTSRNNISLVKGSMAMLKYFYAFGTQAALLRSESGTVSAISGILKAPLDILGDKLRGYIGLAMDLRERPEKVHAACEALAPHLLHVALSGADPAKNVPITIWMHRGCVPFISFKQFDGHYWKTLRPIIESIWSRGHQTLFYAEGNWNPHLNAFLDLPEGSMIYHVDRDDVFDVHKKIGHKFCITGGVPNTMLAFRPASEVKDFCKRIIDEVAPDGGYILDASAIMQNDTTIENVRAMTDFVREYGVYRNPDPPMAEGSFGPAADCRFDPLLYGGGKSIPGVCRSWESKLSELPPIQGDESIFRNAWNDIESLAYTFIWHCLVSF